MISDKMQYGNPVVQLLMVLSLNNNHTEKNQTETYYFTNSVLLGRMKNKEPFTHLNRSIDITVKSADCCDSECKFFIYSPCRYMLPFLA
jgi:hypothetical protein